MATPDLTPALRRLAQYRPFEHEGRDVEAAVRDLVLGAADIQGGSFPDLAACQRDIETLWGLRVEVHEIRDAVASAEASGLCTRHGGGFSLTTAEREQRARSVADSEACEQQALADWEQSVRRREPDLTDEDFTVLCDDLGPWLGHVISRHGIESALILYPEEERAREMFESIENLGLDFLPKRSSRLERLRDIAFQVYIREPSAAQRSHLARLLNTGFFVTVLTLDPAAGRLVQEQIQGHRVYFDTNVLYSLLGIRASETAAEVFSTNRLAELTRGMGMQLAVTPWTVHEFKTSLQRAETTLLRAPLPRQELAEILAQTADDGSITKAYWLAYRDKRVAPKDFFDIYRNVQAHLDEHGIALVEEGITAIDQRTDQVDEHLVLLQRVLGQRWKPEEVMRHDVKHRLLVERLRGAGNLTFSNARYWFITRDSKLPRYAWTHLPDEPTVQLPFCAATSSWMQVMRAFTPRTDEFDATLIDLLATPYVRYRGGPDPAVVHRVVARTDMLRDASPKLAAQIVADTALVKQIADAGSEEEQLSLIDNALISKSREFADRAEQSELQEAAARRETAEERRAREQSEAERDAAQQSLQDLQHRLQALEQSQGQTTAEHAALLQEHASLSDEIARVKQAKEDSESQLREAHDRQAAELKESARHDLLVLKQKVKRGIAATLLLCLAVGCVLLALLVVHDESKGAQRALLTTGAVALCASARVGLGKDHGGEIAQWLGLIISIGGIIWAATS